MKKNIGLMEAFLRTMMGFSLFGKGINWRSSMIVIASSMLIATGITRFCPCYYLMGYSSSDSPWHDMKCKATKMMH